MAREFAKPFYRSKEWQRIRSYILKRDNYLCIRCGNADNTLEVHHKIHLTPGNIMNPSITLNPDNLCTLCKNCHFEIHKEDKLNGIKATQVKTDCGEGYMFDENGMLVKNIGPPLSEK